MLGRKSYTKEEIDAGRKTIDRQLAAYAKLAKAGAKAKTDGRDSDRGPFEIEFFNNMVLVLDRYFVHRLSGPEHEGKDGNPLNEVRLISHKGVMRSDRQIKLPAERSVLGIAVGERIELTEAGFKRLSRAFFEELERRFLDS